jgi:hypothetical protein
LRRSSSTVCAACLSRGLDGTSGVDWSKATEIGYALLLSPLVGFVFSALLLLALKFLVRNPTLYEAPKGNQPPPWWIRGILILTCTGVSFAHGSNDGQKGMGLIMLILIGTVPTAYALNHTPAPSHVESFTTASAAAAAVIEKQAAGYHVLGDPRPAATAFVSQRKINEGTFVSLAALVKEISAQVSQYGSIAKIPATSVGNVRNDMYLASEALRFLMKDKESSLTKPDLGQGRGGDCAGTGHDDRLEAHRRDGRREDRQEPPDLRSGRLGRAGGRRHHRSGRRLWPAGLDHPRAVLGRCRHHGGERLGPADGHGAQLSDGMGAHPAGGNDALGRALHPLPQYLLRTLANLLCVPNEQPPFSEGCFV